MRILTILLTLLIAGPALAADYLQIPLAADQNDVTSGAEETLVWDCDTQVVNDTKDWCDGATGAQSLLTVPTGSDGRYNLSARIGYLALVGSGITDAYFRCDINAVDETPTFSGKADSHLYDYTQLPPTGGTFAQMYFLHDLFLEVGDTITCFLTHFTGSGLEDIRSATAKLILIEQPDSNTAIAKWFQIDVDTTEACAHATVCDVDWGADTDENSESDVDMFATLTGDQDIIVIPASMAGVWDITYTAHVQRAGTTIQAMETLCLLNGSNAWYGSSSFIQESEMLAANGDAILQVMYLNGVTLAESDTIECTWIQNGGSSETLGTLTHLQGVQYGS